MNLEGLANELLLDLFDYLDTNDLFNAFYDLNHHFNDLLFLHSQLHGYYNFQSISKTNFDLVCQDYLPPNLTRITSLHLSDHDETPGQLHLFLSYPLPFSQFISLKSLSITSISSEITLTTIITSLHQLPHFTHLKIQQCQVDHEIINNGWIFDQIWRLTSLIHCCFQRRKYLWNPFFIAPQVLSNSIKVLTLQGFSYHSSELHSLFFHTSSLENLTIDLNQVYDYENSSMEIFSSMNKLHISSEYSLLMTKQFLQLMPNLVDLTVELTHTFISGYEWAMLINQHLSLLKNFRMKMEFSYHGVNLNEEEIERLLTTFRTNFWIVEHRWFIQSHWYRLKKSSKIYFYTLPYSFQDLSLISNMNFQSTLPKNPIDQCDDQAENFDRLRSLNVTLSNEEMNNNALLLEKFIEKSTSLYSLTLSGGSVASKMLFNLCSSSIRRLHLYGCGFFDRKQCEKLIASPLGAQCEVLFIAVNDRRNILRLIELMKNLRVLHIRSQDNEDDLLDWLKDSFPHRCVHLWIC